jgi:hypothetical protein
VHSDEVLSTVYKHKGKPPVPFRHSWRLPFEAEKQRMKRLVRRTGNPPISYDNTRNSVSKNFPIDSPYSSTFSKAFRRDNYRCIFTGLYGHRLLHIAEPEMTNLPWSPTAIECAHIFPQSINSSRVINKNAKVLFAVLSSISVAINDIA